jgi:hypothetical protein
MEARAKFVFGPSLSKESLSCWWHIVALRVPELWIALSGTLDLTLGMNYGVFRVWMNNMEISHVSRQGYPLDLHLANIPPMAPYAYETPRMGRVLQLVWEQIGIVRSNSPGICSMRTSVLDNHCQLPLNIEIMTSHTQLR